MLGIKLWQDFRTDVEPPKHATEKWWREALNEALDECATEARSRGLPAA
jgi:hypothetical protein